MFPAAPRVRCSPSAVAWMTRNCCPSSADTRCATLAICRRGGGSAWGLAGRCSGHSLPALVVSPDQEEDGVGDEGWGGREGRKPGAAILPGVTRWPE